MYAVYFLIFVLGLLLSCFIGWSIVEITSNIKLKKDLDKIWNVKIVNWFINEIPSFKFVKKNSNLFLLDKYYTYYEWNYDDRYCIILWMPNIGKPNVSIHLLNGNDCIISTGKDRKENEVFVEKLKEIIPYV